MIWRVLDPLLLKIARRLQHLAIHHPSGYLEGLSLSRGTFSKLAKVTSRARIDNLAAPDHLKVADYAHIDGEIFLVTPESRCEIGSHTFLGSESRLWIQTEIRVGNFVLIAPRVDIFDNDSYPLDAALRRKGAIEQLERGGNLDYRDVSSQAVIIEDDVWVGTKSTITKGVRLGRGAVVAAGSVVTHDVAPFTLVGGNPARAIRTLDQRALTTDHE